MPARTTPSKPYAGTQSVRRAVTLLKVFSYERPEWGLSDLARAARLNKTTAYRLLTALEAEGLVARSSPSDAWRLGNEAIALGALALRSNDLMSAARPELESLVRDTGETASLEVLVGDEILILDGIEGPSLVGASSEVGTRWPAHATSTGKMLLATARRARSPRRLRKLTPRTITDPARLERELERIRRRGYATAIEELEPGYVAVGAPVRGPDGWSIAAISIGGPTARLGSRRIPEIGRRIVRAADRITARLGGRSSADRKEPRPRETNR
ncbi:MAG TPA: IclR family transcriptional regulator [Gemmatimonadota bacterium]|nr:IclR family transcriptional regulator [Gemmatimonadota bacterium]